MAFIIDAFDHERSQAPASMAPMWRDMMMEAAEKRFGTTRASHPVEHPSDNGSPYTAKETRDFAVALNLLPCFTPVRSLVSNGMAESFVKTFKRDHVRVNPLPDAAAALQQIAG